MAPTEPVRVDSCEHPAQLWGCAGSPDGDRDRQRSDPRGPRPPTMFGHLRVSFRHPASVLDRCPAGRAPPTGPRFERSSIACTTIERPIRRAFETALSIHLAVERDGDPSRLDGCPSRSGASDVRSNVCLGFVCTASTCRDWRRRPRRQALLHRSKVLVSLLPHEFLVKVVFAPPCAGFHLRCSGGREGASGGTNLSLSKPATRRLCAGRGP